eukprot:sb/3468430/
MCKTLCLFYLIREWSYDRGKFHKTRVRDISIIRYPAPVSRNTTAKLQLLPSPLPAKTSQPAEQGLITLSVVDTHVEGVTPVVTSRSSEFCQAYLNLSWLPTVWRRHTYTSFDSQTNLSVRQYAQIGSAAPDRLPIQDHDIGKVEMKRGRNLRISRGVVDVCIFLSPRTRYITEEELYNVGGDDDDEDHFDSYSTNSHLRQSTHHHPQQHHPDEFSTSRTSSVSDYFHRPIRLNSSLQSSLIDEMTDEWEQRSTVGKHNMR